MVLGDRTRPPTKTSSSMAAAVVEAVVMHVNTAPNGRCAPHSAAFLAGMDKTGRSVKALWHILKDAFNKFQLDNVPEEERGQPREQLDALLAGTTH